MGVIEPKESEDRERDVVTPIILVALLILLLLGGGLMYWMIHTPATRMVKLKDGAASAGYSGNQGSMPNWPVHPFEQAPDPGPTLVSLNVKNVTLAQALAELSKQAGIELKLANQPNVLTSLLSPGITLSLKNVPFWDALHEICKHGQVWPASEAASPGAIVLGPDQGKLSADPATSVGSSQFIVTQVVTAFSVTPVNPQSVSSDFDVDFTLLCEPKVPVFHISTVATVEAAADEKGNSLLRAKQPWDERNRSSGSRNKHIGSVTCLLEYPKNNPGDRIATLKGYASVFVADKERTIAIKNPLKVKNQDTDVDGQMIRFGGMSRNGAHQYVAYFYVPTNYPAFADWESLSHAAELLDASGKKLQHQGNGMNGGSTNVMEFSEYFGGQSTGEPTELQMKLPDKLREIRVPFEFHDLPLPH